MEILIYLGVGIFVAVGLSISFMIHDRNRKEMEQLGPRALEDEFRKQREARRG